MNYQEQYRLQARENLSKIKVHYEMKKLEKEQVEREENLLLSALLEEDRRVMQDYLSDIPWYSIKGFYEEFHKEPKTKAEKSKRTRRLKNYRELLVRFIFPECMKDTAIIGISLYNFGYSFELEFELKGDKWQLSIPMPETISQSNYLYESHGELGFTLYKKESDICWAWQMKDKDINEVKKFLQKVWEE